MLPVEKVWEYWTKPEHIIKWNNASDDWHSPTAKNDLRVGGISFTAWKQKTAVWVLILAAFTIAVRPNEYIEFTIGDGRKVKVTFSAHGNTTKVVESF
jgi:uncharacterized protein YndB with AHSA1/START domain